jgi:PAS domain-containing protein
MTGGAPSGPEHSQRVGEWADDLAAARRRVEGFRASASPPAADDLLAELETAYEELRVAEEEVRVQEAELERLIRSQHTARTAHDRLISVLPAPVLVTDAHGIVHTANAAAASVLGMRLDRLLRKPLFAFVEASDRPELRRLLLTALADEREQPRTVATLAVVTPRSTSPQTVEIAATVHRDLPTQRTDVTWVLIGNPRRPEPSARPATEEDSGRGSPGARLARTVVELTRLPIVTADVPDLLSRLAQLCQHAFDRPVFVSITIGDPASPELVATDSVQAQTMDGAQMVAGQGPCADAWAQARTVCAANLRDHPRWPKLAGYLESHDVEPSIVGVAAVPVTVGERTVGALNVYGVDADIAEPANVEAAELLGATVSAVMHETEVKAELATVSEQLRTALESRATIDQAKGIVMAMKGCDPDEAFRHLVGLSSRANRKLKDVAADLVVAAERHGRRP